MSGRETAATIRREATELFFRQGYHGTSLREVAAASGLKVGSLYNHIAGKDDLLLQIMGGIMDDLLVLHEQAVTVTGDAVDTLLAALSVHLRFHAERAREVFIGNAELRNLEGEARATIVAKRHDYQLRLERLVANAGEAGLAEVLTPRMHVYSMVANGNHLASWYRPEGPRPLDDIIGDYLRMHLRELNVTDSDTRVTRLLKAA